MLETAEAPRTLMTMYIRTLIPIVYLPMAAHTPLPGERIVAGSCASLVPLPYYLFRAHLEAHICPIVPISAALTSVGNSK
jgi:hypothetical protein